MLELTRLIGFGSGGGFRVNGLDFDGTTNFLNRGAGLTGAADSPDGWLSCWLRLDGGDGSMLTIMDSPDGGVNNLYLVRNTVNKFSLSGVNNSASATFGMTSATAKTASAAWIHLAMSWQWRTTLVEQIYIDGVSDFGTDDKNAATGTIDYTFTDHYIGQINGPTPTGGVKFNGCMAELIYAPGQTLDLSNSVNMAKLRSPTGKPVDVGNDGSLVTGTAPIVYLSIREGEPISAFGVNRGSGGNFTLTGTFNLASSSPSD